MELGQCWQGMLLPGLGRVRLRPRYGPVRISPPTNHQYWNSKHNVVGTAMEHIQGDQWWTDYQAVSYKIQSKRGSRTQFKNMVSTCHSHGVKVIVDVIFNHMAGIDGGNGVAGSSFSHFNYPGLYSSGVCPLVRLVRIKK